MNKRGTEGRISGERGTKRGIRNRIMTGKKFKSKYR